MLNSVWSAWGTKVPPNFLVVIRILNVTSLSTLYDSKTALMKTMWLQNFQLESLGHEAVCSRSVCDWTMIIYSPFYICRHNCKALNLEVKLGHGNLFFKYKFFWKKSTKLLTGLSVLRGRIREADRTLFFYIVHFSLQIFILSIITL